jgi:hypothetical protein
LNALTLSGDEPRTFSGVPLLEIPPAGDEAQLTSVLARILADLCARPAPETLRRPLQRQEAA